jgi:phosphatidylinositol glycan class S
VLDAADDVGITTWEVDALVRQRLHTHLTTVRSHMRSLVDLLDNVPQMPVSDVIGVNVADAVASYERARAHRRDGDHVAGLAAARRALVCTERAFYDPSMLPALYFPDEHLYAVYSPFFLPVVLPLLVACKQYWVKWKAEKAAASASASAAAAAAAKAT